MPDNPIKTDVMTVNEVAEFLRIHRITIYRMIENGQLHPFRIGRVWRFSRKQLIAQFADARKAPLVTLGPRPLKPRIKKKKNPGPLR